MADDSLPNDISAQEISQPYRQGRSRQWDEALMAAIASRDESEKIRIGRFLIEAGVRPSVGMSEGLYHVFMAGYFSLGWAQEATARQQVTMAYRQARRALAVRGDLKEVRRQWGRVYSRLTIAEDVVGASSFLDLSACQWELESALDEQVCRIVTGIDNKAFKDCENASGLEQKLAVAMRIWNTLERGHRTFVSLQRQYSMEKQFLFLGNIRVAADRWKQRWEKCRKEIANRRAEARIKAQEDKGQQQEEQETQRQRSSTTPEALQVLADAILRILQSDVERRFTFHDLMLRLPDAIYEWPRNESARRGVVSRAVALLRRDRHSMPRYGYMLGGPRQEQDR